MSIPKAELSQFLHESLESPPEYGFWPNATLKLFITNACDLNCRGCFNRSNLKASLQGIGIQSLSKEQLFTVMDDARSAFDTYAVEFSGGEPTLLPELPKLIAYAKSIGFATRIATNGTVLGAYGDFKKQLDEFLPSDISKLSAEERIKQLLDSGLDRFLFSVDNMHTMPDQEFRPGSMIAPKVPVSVVTNAIRILLRFGIGFPKEDSNLLDRNGISIGMTASGSDYLPSLKLVEEVMQRVGAKPELKRGERLPKRWITDDGQEIRLNRNETADIGQGYRMDMAGFKGLKDFYSRNCYDFIPRSQSSVRNGINQEIAVNYDGEVYNCAMQSYPLGNINSHSLPEIVEYVNLGIPPDNYRVGAKMFMEIMHIVEETKGQAGWGEAYRRIIEMDPSLETEISELKSHSGACHALGHNARYLELLQQYRILHEN